MTKVYTMGLDYGSTASKGVILLNGSKVVESIIYASGAGTSGPQKVIEALEKKSGMSMSDMDKVVVTGYGRMSFKAADKQISELSCHAKGVHFLVPDARTVIDIGGQDAKALSLDDDGRLTNFVMNDKCAAGTGRFLDVMSGVLETEVSELGALSAQALNPVSISSTCTVFAESEVISHLSKEIPKEDIIAGIHASVAGRVSGLVKRVGVRQKVVMVGGVARNEVVVKAMEEALGVDIIVPEFCAQLNGALGAALFAYEEAISSNHYKEEKQWEKKKR